jgi:hypothetical protein
MLRITQGMHLEPDLAPNNKEYRKKQGQQDSNLRPTD